MRAVFRISPLIALVAAACGSGGGGDALPTGATLVAPGIRVEILTRPLRVTVFDPSGKPVLESRESGGGDGYAGLGWTTGKLDIVTTIFPGYFKAEPGLDPWRDDLSVVALASSETSAQLTLSSGRTPELVVVTYTVRPSALRVEAHVEGATPRAWEVGFRAPADEGYLGLGERFTRTNFRGLSIYSWCEEGGI